MADLHKCQKCEGFLVKEAASEWRCIQCGRREHRGQPLAPAPLPLTSTNPSKSTRKKKTTLTLKKVSVPNLSPPPTPSTDELQRSTFATYQHFRKRAAFHRDEVRSCSEKNHKLTAGYRARLCEHLAATLARIYTWRIQKALRNSLRKQRQVDHVISKSDGTANKLEKRYGDLMLQAMSHLADDPLVQEWRGCREALGDRLYLRRARKGLEVGVKRPYPSPSDGLADMTILDLATESGMSPGKIRKDLKAQGLRAPSREGIRKRLKAHSIQVKVSPRAPRK